MIRRRAIENLKQSRKKFIYISKNYYIVESPGLDPAQAFQNYRPGQKPSQANPAGPAWPGLFWLGLARLTASGQSRNITSRKA